MRTISSSRVVSGKHDLRSDTSCVAGALERSDRESHSRECSPRQEPRTPAWEDADADYEAALATYRETAAELK
jgi:hypothetical protein